ncbi:MAG: hypothetical protein JF612_10880, partial [Planctomycetia bacterium]|nr:hypothetical protein [Planctomycetia bacterium]
MRIRLNVFSRVSSCLVVSGLVLGLVACNTKPEEPATKPEPEKPAATPPPAATSAAPATAAVTTASAAPATDPKAIPAPADVATPP